MMISSDSRYIERMASLEDQNPLEKPKLGKYGILVYECPPERNNFYRTADTIIKIEGLSMDKITPNSRLNTFTGHQSKKEMYLLGSFLISVHCDCIGIPYLCIML